jgi:hypothetical protein
MAGGIMMPAGTMAAGMGGARAGSGGMNTGGMGTAGEAGMAGEPGMGMGECCSDGDCYCHGDPPSAPTSAEGPFATDSYPLSGVGCVYYPTDAEPPFAVVTISDGFLGAGGCALAQTGGWGPLLSSWGIVTVIIDTLGSDQPPTRGAKLTAAVAGMKEENMNSGSPLSGKLGDRYGTAGFSMGGGGTTYAAQDDPTLNSNMPIMAWAPVSSGITVPSLFIFGNADALAGTMGMSSYRGIDDSVPKMAVTVSSGHAGQPSSGGGASGEAGLAFQKVFLEGDERWRPILLMVDADESTIQ